MSADQNNIGSLMDFKINVKLRLSALWVTVMLCYVYGDIFSLFVPERLKNLMNGNMGSGTTTPAKLLFSAVLLAIPALMVFLSLVLKPKLNKWLNIILGFVYTLVMVLVVYISIDPWWIFYIFLGIVEIVITLAIIWQAWKWPRA
ncbi:hypothetical protein H7F33_17805 [Pedobacter sp. PAMC26386]|nr:hypothetical protein H7F33_17805 [Pedobacter sp. PAMC26386]